MQISPPAFIAAHLRVRLVGFCPTALLSRRDMNLKSTCRPFSQAGGKHWSLSPSLCLLCLGMRSFSNREQSLQCPIRSVKQNKLARSAALCRHSHTQTTTKKKNHMQDHLSAFFFFTTKYLKIILGKGQTVLPRYPLIILLHLLLLLAKPAGAENCVHWCVTPWLYERSGEEPRPLSESRSWQWLTAVSQFLNWLITCCIHNIKIAFGILLWESFQCSKKSVTLKYKEVVLKMFFPSHSLSHSITQPYMISYPKSSIEILKSAYLALFKAFLKINI